MAEDGGDDDIFVYMGGDQVVPEDVRRVRIDKSVKKIPNWAFDCREQLIDVKFHDGIEEIGNWAFSRCYSLKSVRLLGVKLREKVSTKTVLRGERIFALRELREKSGTYYYHKYTTHRIGSGSLPVYGSGVVYYLDRTGSICGIMLRGLPFAVVPNDVKYSLP
eukprot:scaffold11743_cov95-Skeletonema_dohrnii-CCMP3373.AAC.2